MYEYRGEVTRVVDGDTIHARLDLGLDVRIDVTLRLHGINAPEHGTAAGDAATSHLVQLLSPANHLVERVVTVRTIKDHREKYGRYLAVLIRDDGMNVNEQMVADGHAVHYAGGPR